MICKIHLLNSNNLKYSTTLSRDFSKIRRLHNMSSIFRNPSTQFFLFRIFETNSRNSFFPKLSLADCLTSTSTKSRSKHWGDKYFLGATTIVMGSFAASLTHGLMARNASAASKERWELRKSEVDQELREGDLVPLSVLVPRAMRLSVLFVPFIFFSIPAFFFTDLRQLWIRFLVWTLERSGSNLILLF